MGEEIAIIAKRIREAINLILKERQKSRLSINKGEKTGYSISERKKSLVSLESSRIECNSIRKQSQWGRAVEEKQKEALRASW